MSYANIAPFGPFKKISTQQNTLRYFWPTFLHSFKHLDNNNC